MKLRTITINVAVVLYCTAVVSGQIKYFHSKQDGIVKIWPTINGEKVGPIPLESFEVEDCNFAATGLKKVKDYWLFWTDIKAEFTCYATGKTTQSKFSINHHDGTQWNMQVIEEWYDFGLGMGTDNWFPGLNSDDQDLHIAIDVLFWQENNGQYELTGPGELLRYYEFSNGISPELPGVYVSTTELIWDPTLLPDNPHRGWASAGWYTGIGEVYDCHEFTTIPEPATVCLLGLGSLALVRRRRG